MEKSSVPGITPSILALLMMDISDFEVRCFLLRKSVKNVFEGVFTGFNLPSEPLISPSTLVMAEVSRFGNGK